jgi:hypothetical protein
MKKLSWRSLNQQIPHMTESEVLSLLQDERRTERRVVVLERLHQRYSALRVARERIEILKEAKQP